MKKILFISVLFLAVFKMQGQILSDSSAQVVGWWNIGDTQTYRITSEGIDFADGELLSRSVTRYSVTITIIDYTDYYYLINWYYHDFEIYNDDEELLKMLLAIPRNKTLTVRTNVLGTFIEIVNWEELRDHVRKGFEIINQMENENPLNQDLLEEFPDFFNLRFAQAIDMYSTRENLEATQREITTFYFFHGSQFNLGERHITTVEQPNLLGGASDATMTFWLSEIYLEHGMFLMQMHQKTNPKELAINALLNAKHLIEVEMRPLIERGEATEDDLKEALEEIANTDIEIRHEVQLNSIIHNSGWLIHSTRTQENIIGDTMQVRTLTIELQQ